MDSAERYTDEQIEQAEAEIHRQYLETAAEVLAAFGAFFAAVKAFDKRGGTNTERMLLKPSQREFARFAAILTAGNVKANQTAALFANNVRKYNAEWQWKNLLRMGGFEREEYDRISFEDVLKNIRKFYPATLDLEKDQKYNSKKFRQAIVKSLNNGAGVPQMAKDIQAVIDTNESAAIMRARTAATGAQNKSRLDSLRYAEKTFGIKYVKVWDSSHDSRVRPSHQRLTGEEREIDEPFSNGLMYPGDSSGSWEEVANCRCKVKYKKVKI